MGSYTRRDSPAHPSHHLQPAVVDGSCWCSAGACLAEDRSATQCQAGWPHTGHCPLPRPFLAPLSSPLSAAHRSQKHASHPQLSALALTSEFTLQGERGAGAGGPVSSPLHPLLPSSPPVSLTAPHQSLPHAKHTSAGPPLPTAPPTVAL